MSQFDHFGDFQTLNWHYLVNMQTFTQFEFESFPTQMKIELICLI